MAHEERCQHDGASADVSLTVSSDAASPRPLSTVGRVYVATVVLAGALALASALVSLVREPVGGNWVLLAGLAWVGGLFAVRVPTSSATISVSEVFVFTLVLLFGGSAATVAVALDGLFRSLHRRNLRTRHVLFNIAEPALAIWLASAMFETIAGQPAHLAPTPLGELVWPVMILAATYLLLNTGLTALFVAAETEVSPVHVWKQHIVYLSVNLFGGASIALVLSEHMPLVNVRSVVLVLPLVLILYLVLRTWAGRIEDATDHVREVNRLYFSTIEALATAIESKDQVTHGHVRRVQWYSLALARELGVTDAAEIRALEAAALLHDMGKLAVPDFILNKPGRLTPAEFDRMMQHAAIGADILSTVHFPYPVVPIVRHHHENWDGTGYPDGLAGAAIPIGARILSVADCFDALTSDRPYRRALTDDHAMELIRARSGTMYDPGVVETLARTYRQLRANEPAMPAPTLPTHALSRLRRLPDEEPARELTPPAEPLEAFERLSRFLDEQGVETAETRERALALVAAFLRRWTPAAAVAIGRVDRKSGLVQVAHAAGHGEFVLRDLRWRLGEGISGWVAAHCSVSMNSDAGLDLDQRVVKLAPRLASALSVPIARGADGIGVLTLYGLDPAAFAETDQILAQRVAKRLRPCLEDAPRDPVAPVSVRPAVSAAALPSEVDLEVLTPPDQAAPATVGVLSVGLAAPAGAAGGEPENLLGVAAITLTAIRISDSIVKVGRDEIVAVLPGCDPVAGDLILARLASAAGSEGLAGILSAGFGCTPLDGATMAEALSAARQRRVWLGAREERRWRA